ncbi:hypothetical protein O181_030871 [Austropuccinia psidii MF-1]|uniref:DUS-like FMN-binding domain-containing protein n=1 Tax=Austropuccinia psidii MF-1 TaxID=1389203 RepID=A0A9Q3H4N1_9BASI|nr:hypothetical protein [Austropuccinia psidii MF-1]
MNWLSIFSPSTRLGRVVHRSAIAMANLTRSRSASISSHSSPNDIPRHQVKRTRLDLLPADDALPVSTSNSRSGLYVPGLYLAPMVRIGTLPTRLLALEYGADLVWGPEIVDKAIIGSTRAVDQLSGTIQYTKNSGMTSIWQTHPIEKSRLIYQIGSADKELALQAAKTVADDVSGIDLNCGCPKDFSLKGGMGAALLKEPAKLCSILSHLVENLPSHPISVKIRLLPEQKDTLALIKDICSTGVSCLTVHCRTQPMRSTEPALLHRLKEIVDYVNNLRHPEEDPLPVVANGDCFGAQDFEKIKSLTGVARVMIARGAESNVSCFRKEGLLDPVAEVMPRYIKAGILTGQGYPNAKYCLSTMDIKSTKIQENDATSVRKFSRKELKSKIQSCKTWSQICDLFAINIEEKSQNHLHQLFPKVSAIEPPIQSQSYSIQPISGRIVSPQGSLLKQRFFVIAYCTGDVRYFFGLQLEDLVSGFTCAIQFILRQRLVLLNNDFDGVRKLQKISARFSCFPDASVNF